MLDKQSDIPLLQMLRVIVFGYFVALAAAQLIDSCEFTFVESIPEGLTFPPDSPTHPATHHNPSQDPPQPSPNPSLTLAA